MLRNLNFCYRGVLHYDPAIDAVLKKSQQKLLPLFPARRRQKGRFPIAERDNRLSPAGGGEGGGSLT